MKHRNRLRRYLITAGIALAVTVLVFWARDGFTQTDSVAVLQAFCDGFFVPGILCVGFGALVFCADDGLFDMMHFGVMKAINLIRSEKKRNAYPRTFYDYREMKSGRRRGTFGHYFVVGIVWIALAALFLVLSENRTG